MDGQIMKDLGTAIGFLVTLAVAVVGGRYSMKKTHAEAKATPYAQIVERVGELEEIAKQVGALEERVNALEAARENDRAYIKLAIPWIDDHKDLAKYPPPYPPHWWQHPSKPA